MKGHIIGLAFNCKWEVLLDVGIHPSQFPKEKTVKFISRFIVYKRKSIVRRKVPFELFSYHDPVILYIRGRFDGNTRAYEQRKDTEDQFFHVGRFAYQAQ